MTSSSKTLVILSAGMASRYGSLKQVEKFGPSGESIIDYTLYDALKIGFNKIVFIIRNEFRQSFEKKFSNKIPPNIQIKYVVQELHSGVGDFIVSADRQKPWGTGHAVLVAKDVVKEAFVVVNADDFYGKHGLQSAYDFMTNNCTENTFGLIGYNLKTTLSKHGSVNRGVCIVNDDGNLIEIQEKEGIELKDDKAIYLNNGIPESINVNRLVSMNLWIFHHNIFSLLQQLFNSFLKERAQELKSEFYIPNALDYFIHKKNGKINVIPNNKDKWFGVTYKEDAKYVKNQIQALINKGRYPSKLWI